MQIAASPSKSWKGPEKGTSTGMFSHAPANYECPVCRIAAGNFLPSTRTQAADVIAHDPMVTAFIASHWWPNNPGHVLVIPNQHFENIYDLPGDLAAPIHAMSCRVAIAMKHEYRCDGVSTRQHNEPAGNQDIWHYHLHVFPRHAGDDLYRTDREETTPGERARYADVLRN